MNADAVLKTVTTLTGIWPGGQALHDLLVKYHDQIEQIAPIVENIGEAGSALAAAEKAAPELAAAIREYVKHLPLETVIKLSAAPATAPTPFSAVARENITRAVFGMPAMTSEEEKGWMAAQTAQVGNPSFGG